MGSAPMGDVYRIIAYALYYLAEIWKVLNSNAFGPKDFK